MNITRTRFGNIVRLIGAALAILVVIGYAGYRSLPYIRGPVIRVFQPVNGATISSSTVTVIGRADRINAIALNNNPLIVDESGNFKQTIVVFPGVNIITLFAGDQFNRTKKAEIRIYGTGSFPETRTGTSSANGQNSANGSWGGLNPRRIKN